VCHSLIKELGDPNELNKYYFNYTIPLDEETYLNATEKLSIPFETIVYGIEYDNYTDCDDFFFLFSPDYV